MEDKNDTRERIFQATVQLVKKNGFENVTIDDICEYSSLTKGAFYYYAKSKADVLGQYLMDQIGRVDQDRMSYLGEILIEENCYKQLLLLVKPLLDVCEEIGPEIIHQVMLNNHKGQYVTSLIGRGNKDNIIITNLIEKGQKQSIFRNQQRADLLCEIIGDTMYGMMFYWCNSRAGFDLRNKVKDILQGILDVND
ncbi:MAG: TetR/AcrR family transcriptional regulator [Anaerolineales bacterium]|nr:TetR/AcrR family transcriptional regulator [Anaerolineales bacterium]